jgi:hypothetical protein
MLQRCLLLPLSGRIFESRRLEYQEVGEKFGKEELEISLNNTLPLLG